MTVVTEQITPEGGKFEELRWLTDEVKERFWSKVELTEECWLWTAGKTTAGYGTFCVKHGHSLYAHRLSSVIHDGPLPRNIYVLHRCDNPACVRPEHLFRGTQKDNMQDCVEKGRLNPGYVAGERNGMSVLTNDQVRELRRAYAAGKGCSALAKETGINRSTIKNVVLHPEKYWREV